MVRRFSTRPSFCQLLLAAGLALGPVASATAEPNLTDFAGLWSGSGTDRDMPFAAFQQTQCQTRVTADASHMASDMTCQTKAGGRKRMKLTAAFAGAKFSGSAEQTSAAPDGSVKRHAGSITGVREGDVAKFEIHFGALTPNAHVVIEITSPNTFRMRSSVLGSVLSSVEFHRDTPR
jgi:hypothetical protein